MAALWLSGLLYSCPRLPGPGACNPLLTKHHLNDLLTLIPRARRSRNRGVTALAGVIGLKSWRRRVSGECGNGGTIMQELGKKEPSGCRMEVIGASKQAGGRRSTGSEMEFRRGKGAGSREGIVAGRGVL